MTTTATKLITAKEFAALPNPPDGSKQELVRGAIITMPPPGFPHGRCQVKTCYALETYARQTRAWLVTVETGVITETDPDTVRGPDVAVWKADRLPLDQMPEGYPEIFPDLCVEVLSPSNTWRQINAKIREYFRGGVKMVWIIDPERRTVTVYRQSREGTVLGEEATLTVEDLLPGFSCPWRSSSRPETSVARLMRRTSHGRLP
jgi:Uma2 family endonuclease